MIVRKAATIGRLILNGSMSVIVDRPGIWAR